MPVSWWCPIGDRLFSLHFILIYFMYFPKGHNTGSSGSWQLPQHWIVIFWHFRLTYGLTYPSEISWNIREIIKKRVFPYQDAFLREKCKKAWKINIFWHKKIPGGSSRRGHRAGLQGFEPWNDGVRVRYMRLDFPWIYGISPYPDCEIDLWIDLSQLIICPPNSYIAAYISLLYIFHVYSWRS